MKRIGIIGCGRFGQALVESLSSENVELLLIDSNEDRVNLFADIVTRVVQGDATNPAVLKEAGFDECDEIVVCIAGDMEGSILATVNAKELGVKTVISRAVSEVHRKVLKRIGADIVIYPDRDRAQSLAKSLISRTAIDVFEIADGLSIAEIEPPSELVGRTIAEGAVRQTYSITILAIRRLTADPRLPRTTFIPSGTEQVLATDRLIVFGYDIDLDKLVDK
jgi:trk system potassium uptake protein TrkA